MTEIVFSRVDFRLIHGQVITKWIRQTKANKIVIIDDQLAKDEFMLNIYTMAAPPGFPVLVYSVKEAIDKWATNQFGEGKIFLLFKTIEAASGAIEGLPIERLQIGGLGFTKGRLNVHGAISLDQEDADQLCQLAMKRVVIYFQQVPDEKASQLEDIIRKYGFKEAEENR